MIEVVKPGLVHPVQDAGREGYYHVGIPPSGALDQFSLAAANLLVGNADGRGGAGVRLPRARSCVVRSRRVVAVAAPTGAARGRRRSDRCGRRSTVPRAATL
jgi:allophanate hydrolase subunit 2